MRLRRLPITFATVLLGVAPVAAQSGDAAMAESLYQQGRKLMEEQKYAEACDKLAASLQLDRGAGGTLMSLALCHEKQGKTATAWAEFSDAVAAARRDGRPEREKAAREHMSALEAKLAKLVVRVAPEVATLEGLEVRRDAIVLPRGVWGAEVPVDPGEHLVEATAAKRKKWTMKVTLSGEGDVKTLEIKQMERQPNEAMTASKPTPPPPQPASATPAAETAPPSNNTTLAYVLVGVGVVGIATGAYFGVQALSKRSDVLSSCPNGSCPTQAGIDAHDQAKTSQLLADVGIGVGLAAGAIGTYLLLSSNAPGAAARFRIAPTLTRGDAGVVAGGAW